MFLLAQIIGILGMAMNVISYQAKKQRNIILIQFFGSLFFTINMFMLSAYTGALMNLIGVIRAYAYANKDKILKFKYINLNLINIIFIVAFLLSYILVFALFGKPFNAINVIIEFLPIIAMIVTTLAFSKQSAKSVRRAVFISSPSWLTYNCFNFAIGGIICEVFTLTSAIIAMIRFKKEK